MPPYLDRRIYELSPSGNTEREVAAGKVFEYLKMMVDAGPYDNVAFVKTGLSNSCILKIESKVSMASANEESIAVEAYFPFDNGRYSMAHLLRAHKRNIFGEDNKRLDVEETTDLLAGLQSLANDDGETAYAAPEELEFL